MLDGRTGGDRIGMVNGQDFKVMLGTAFFGVLVGLASLRACPVEAAEESPVADETPSTTPTPTPNDLKRKLLDEAGLRRVHHEVYRKVGERDWEARVKPAFLRDLTLATARENGTLLPEIDEVLEWVRTHPGEARELLRRHVP